MFFNYSKDIREVIYSTNVIKPLNSVIWTAVNKRKVFLSDQAACKVVCLATQQASNLKGSYTGSRMVSIASWNIKQSLLYIILY